MPLNFNVKPYYDDFKPSKNFHRILFKPGFAVQARELTQAQSILQDQITKFANHIFKQNVPVTGGQVTTNLKCFYVKLQDTYQGAAIDVSQFVGKLVRNASGSVLARVLQVSDGSISLGTDPATLVVSYESGSQFSDNDVIYDSASNLTAQAIPSGSTGSSSVASISQGVFYVAGNYPADDGTIISNGTFVQVNPQTIIISKYSNSPNNRIGLNVTETIYDYVNDPSLLDPAVGASNYQAPGADRYVIQLTLESRPLEYAQNDDGFIELVRVNNGRLAPMADSSIYSNIDDYFAKRTYETNGDYVVNDFNITPVTSTNPAKYNLRIGKGVAYVKGFRLENNSDLVISNDRARTTATQNNNSVFLDYGSYFYVDGSNGFFDVTTASPIDLHTIDLANVVATNTTTYNSTLAGTGYIRNFVYDSNVSDSNTKSYIYKAYVFDITTKVLSSNAVSGTATTITLFDTNGKFSNIANAYYGVALTIDSGPSAGDVRKIVSYSGATKIATVDIPFSVIPTTSSQISLRFGSKDVELVANTNPANSLSIVASANINSKSKLNGIVTNDTLLKNTGFEELIAKIGYPYVSSLSNGIYTTAVTFRNISSSVAGATSTLTLNTADYFNNVFQFIGGPGTLSADVIKQNYTVILSDNLGDTANNGNTGAILDFVTSGNTVTSNGTTLTLTSNKYKSFKATIIAKMNITDTNSSSIRKTKTLVSGTNTSVDITGTDGIIASNSYINLSKGQTYIKKTGILGLGGQQSLYVSDVRKIVKIVDTQVTTSNAAYVLAAVQNPAFDISRNYSFNNGQKDSYYDHAFITLNPGAPVPKGDIMVIYDYYQHAGDGYFSVYSYPDYASIPTYTAKNGTTYNLRDCLDFRPTRRSAVSSFLFEYTNASVAKGYLIPQDLSSFVSNYSYYLGRKDKLVLSKDSNFQIIQGNPSITPILPVAPDTALVIANITNDPYTVYIPGEAPKGILPSLSIEKVQHRRWLMSDISDLQTRVNNIEYYASLNVLEQKTQQLQVPDANGLNRFKNGILVDDFSSYATADSANPDFSASIDRVTKNMTASQVVSNYPLQSAYMLSALNNIAASPSSLGFKVNNIGKVTNYFSLPYTDTILASQKLASNTVNLNPFTTPLFQGVMHLNPPMDNWVDNKKEPDLLLVDPNLQIYQQSDTLNVLNVTNWQTIPGTEYTTLANRTNVIGHNINPSPYGYVGYQNDTYNTFAKQSQQTTQGYWSNLGSSYNQNNGFITDVSIQPYIRQQQLIFRAKGLKVNTPVGAYFDGINVSNYVSSPDVIELNSVTGKFQEDDVIGYKSIVTGAFYPIATVISSFVGSNTQNVRLYVTGNFHSGFGKMTSGSNPTFILSNALFDASGNYVANTAFGIVSSKKVVSTTYSGYVTSVGGSFTDDAANTQPGLFSSMHPAGSEFANMFGVWNAPTCAFDDSGALVGNTALPVTYDASFNVFFPGSGTYYFKSGADANARFFLTDTSTNEMNALNVAFNAGTQTGTPGAQTVVVSAGTHLLRWVAKNDASAYEGDSQVAVAISTAPWTGSTTTGTIIFASNSPNGVLPSGITSASNMPGGGVLYAGVTKIGLVPTSSSNSSYFATGSQINVRTTTITQSAVGAAPSITTQTYNATITAYDGVKKVVTVSPAIPFVSVGFNTLTGGSITSTYSLVGTQNSYLVTQTNGGLANLSTNEIGDFVGIFNVPQSTFKTGERVFRVDNRTVPTDSSTVTTWAESTFTASGLSTKSQALDFAPSISAAKNTFTRTQIQDSVLINTATVINPWDPVAQTFIIDKTNYPNGAFLSSVRFFFQSKPTTNSPVTLSIVNTLNGYPNGETLDNSIVLMTPDAVNTSTTPHYLDSTTYTEFVFPAPVYIQPNTLYAFILRSPSSDYNVYLAAQNATAIPSSVKNLPTDATPSVITKIGTSPYVGSMFESQNAITWTTDQSKSLMFVLNRCVFDITANPKVQFIVPKGLPQRKYVSQDIQNYYSSNFVNNNQGLSTNKDVNCDAFNLSTTDFVPTNTKVNYSFISLLKSGSFEGERNVLPGKFGSPTYENLYLNDGKGERKLQANSNATFSMYATLSSNDNTVSPFVSDDGTSLYNVQWNINNLSLSNSVISLVSGGAAYNTNTTIVTISAPDVSGGAQAYAAANVANGVVQSVYITSGGSGYLLTPTIAITDTANTTPGNNNTAITSVVSEYSPRGGNAAARYITKKVTLTDGNDSGDLRVYMTAYRPPSTEIYVFYRVQNKNDTQSFENGTWQLMTYVNNTAAFSGSRNDLYELQFAPGINGVANNQLSYISTNGNTYTKFNQFAIKIVLVSSDNTFVPFLNDLRVLALPSGTGV